MSTSYTGGVGQFCDLSNIPLVWPFSVYFLPVVLYLFSVVGSGSVWLGDKNTSSSSSLPEKSQSSKCFIEETKDWPWVHGSALFLMASSKIKSLVQAVQMFSKYLFFQWLHIVNKNKFIKVNLLHHPEGRRGLGIFQESLIHRCCRFLQADNL